MSSRAAAPRQAAQMTADLTASCSLSCTPSACWSTEWCSQLSWCCPAAASLRFHQCLSMLRRLQLQLPPSSFWMSGGHCSHHWPWMPTTFHLCCWLFKTIASALALRWASGHLTQCSSSPAGAALCLAHLVTLSGSRTSRLLTFVVVVHLL